MATEILRPNAAGDECNIPYEKVAACPNHYQEVDEVAADGYTTEVNNPDPGWQRDLYDVGSPTGSGVISSVTVYSTCLAKKGPNQSSLKLVVKSGSTVEESSEITLSGQETWEENSQAWATNPATGSAWTWAEIESLQIGISIRRSDTSGAWATACTQLYVIVTYVIGDSTAAPSVTTQAVSDIAKTTATGNGTVVSLGVPAATQHGVCWATFPNPEVTDDNPSCSETEDGVPSATGAYTSSMTDLKANTKYYVRAYITNAVGTFYGDQVEFTTLTDVPEVTTYLAKKVATLTALGSGNIDNDGGSPITEHGVLWRAGADPTITTYDGKTEKGATTWKYFTSLMGETPNPLTANTEYHYRAYAVNDEGVGYGDVLKFTTSVAGGPIVKTRATINITPTSATGRGVVTDTGGDAITAYGHCYKAVTDPPTFPTISDSTKETTGAPTIDEVFLSELADLTSGTAYVLRAYATNSFGTGYGDAVNTNEIADELKGQIAFQDKHLLYTDRYGDQRRLLGAKF